MAEQTKYVPWWGMPIIGAMFGFLVWGALEICSMILSLTTWSLGWNAPSRFLINYMWLPIRLGTWTAMAVTIIGWCNIAYGYYQQRSNKGEKQ